jgi:hypothetical protein
MPPAAKSVRTELSPVWVAVRYRAVLLALSLAAGTLLPAYDTSTPLLYPTPSTEQPSSLENHICKATQGFAQVFDR